MAKVATLAKSVALLFACLLVIAPLVEVRRAEAGGLLGIIESALTAQTTTTVTITLSTSGTATSVTSNNAYVVVNNWTQTGPTSVDVSITNISGQSQNYRLEAWGD